MHLQCVRRIPSPTTMRRQKFRGTKLAQKKPALLDLFLPRRVEQQSSAST
jgi:hypothetical protein